MTEFALHASVAELCALLDITQDPSDWAAALKAKVWAFDYVAEAVG